MKTLNLYVTKSFVSTFLMAIGILTFAMMGVNLIKVFDYLARGIPVGAALQFLFYIMPYAVAFTVPFSILVSVMLIFGRMSADNEITAMRACGVSILQIISPIIIITFLLTVLCLYLQVDLAPRFRAGAETLVKGVIVNQPLTILEPGRSIEYQNIYIYVDDKIGENEIRDIQIFRMSKDRKKVEQDITATNGKIEVDKENQVLKIILFNATIVYDSGESTHPRRSFSKRVEFPLNYGKEFNRIKIAKRTKHLSLTEIFGRTLWNKKRGIDTTRLEIELNRRIALALSPIAFLLLGMPLAIRTSRKETSVGLFLSVILAGIYFISVMIFDSLYTQPQLRPQILLWIPNILYQTIGAYFLFRIARR